jgi:hypothetical protein
MSTSNFKDTSLFGDKLSFSDIEQGELNDCYFLSGCAAYAKHKYRLEYNILTDEINKAGLFAMNGYVRGIPSTFVVDDYIPFNVFSSATTPVFA